MMHITKILYGYWLGLLYGYVLCVAWEVALYTCYLQHVPKTLQIMVQKHVSQKRKEGTLVTEIAIICLSTLPLQTKVLIYSLSDVCKYEFIAGCMIPTSIMTMKNVIVGKMLTLHPSPSTLAVMASVISFSLILPTLSTIFFSSSAIFLLKNVDEIPVEEEVLINKHEIHSTILSVIPENEACFEFKKDDPDINIIINHDAIDTEQACIPTEYL
jgi:hypothetical protein